jgi:hypothetical protein
MLHFYYVHIHSFLRVFLIQFPSLFSFQLLGDLESNKKKLVLHLSAREHNDTVLTLRRPEQRGHEAIVFDSSGNLYHSERCTPTVIMSPQQKAEISEVMSGKAKGSNCIRK